jgi:hypothetical protein
MFVSAAPPHSPTFPPPPPPPPLRVHSPTEIIVISTTTTIVTTIIIITIISQAIVAIARGCGHSLTSLNLTWCVNCDDNAMAAVASSCLKLELLSVFGLVHISDACLDALASNPKGCPTTLTTLDVHGCCNVSY